MPIINPQDSLIGQEPEDLAPYIGNFFINLGSLEFIMRAYICRILGEEFKSPKFNTLNKGDICSDLGKGWILRTLSDVIDEFNKLVSYDYKVDTGIIELRNALAHGIYFIDHKNKGINNVTLFKINNKYMVDFIEPITINCLKNNINIIAQKLLKITKLYDSIKYN